MLNRELTKTPIVNETGVINILANFCESNDIGRNCIIFKTAAERMLTTAINIADLSQKPLSLFTFNLIPHPEHFPLKPYEISKAPISQLHSGHTHVIVFIIFYSPSASVISSPITQKRQPSAVSETLDLQFWLILSRDSFELEHEVVGIDQVTVANLRQFCAVYLLFLVGQLVDRL